MEEIKLQGLFESEEEITPSELKEIEDFEQLHTIIHNPESEADLEQQKNEWDGMTKKQRRMSDWKALDIYGMTNTEYYEKHKSEYNKQDIKDHDDIITIVGEAGIVYVPNENINDIILSKVDYSEGRIEDALEWAARSMRIIITPQKTLEELEELWSKWNQQIKKHRRESDWKALELFGVDNKYHYEILKSKFLKHDIDDDPDPKISPDYEEDNHKLSIFSNSDNYAIQINSEIVRESKDFIKISELLLNLKEFATDNIVDQLTVTKYIDDTVKYFKDNLAYSVDQFDLPVEMPFFTPTEMDQLGVYKNSDNCYETDPDNMVIDKDTPVLEWFKSYKEILETGIMKESDHKLFLSRNHKLQELYLDFDMIKESGNEEIINKRKQSILELGWNPDIDYTEENRAVVSKYMKERIIKEKTSDVRIIDLSNQDIDYEEPISESAEKQTKFPVHIVLTFTGTEFGKAIKAITKSTYSHAAIALDKSFDKLYTFNASVNGFNIESIKNYKKKNPEGDLGIYTFFVNKSDHDKIKKRIQYFSDNKNKTHYSGLNVLGALFNIPFNFDFKMICSQFVDSIIKFANIDITGKNSSMVIPKDFENLKVKNLYKLYEGKLKDFNDKNIKGVLNKLITKAKLMKKNIKEANIIDRAIILAESYSTSEELKFIYENSIKPYFDPDIILLEVKEFPVQFDEDGNLLIRKIDTLDFNAEYAKSHKLLLNYEKFNNTDGIKYELSKLWFLNTVLEKRIYSGKYKQKEVDEYNKARALILNDFNKYLKYILDKEKSFNFTEYYNSTPFSDVVIKIKRSTLKYTAKLLKDLIIS